MLAMSDKEAERVTTVLLGPLFNIRSVRQTVRKVQTNLAYRWFLGLGIDEKVPDHSTISQAYRRRFQGNDVFQQIFEEIVRQAESHGLVSGRILITDSTHIRANAKKELKPASEKRERRLVKVSRTDPDAGYMYRDQKPEGFFWLAHRTVDAKHNFIVDVHVTPGNVSDSTVYLNRLDHVLERFHFPLEAVAPDAGYFTTGIAKALVERGIFGVIARRRFGEKKGMFRKTRYTYLP
ncbi:hypothetical protein EXIGUO8H_380010 [Exiguobacterium sp. 8H]